VDTVKNVLAIYAQLLKSMQVRREKIAAAMQDDFSTATELADYLALRGLPFREAHHLVGKLVRHCLDEEKLLKDLSSEELAAFHPFLGSDEALARLSPENAVRAKKSRGGTAPEAVRRQLKAAREALKR
jgi:argininosuccinate lyase